MSDPDALRRAAVAAEIAHEAGELLLDAAAAMLDGDDLEVHAKSGPTDLASEADEASERLIADRLAAAFADDGLLGEEGQAPRPSRSGLTWVVDPLDGTANFLHGIPQWSVSIACVDAEGVLLGIVYDPNRGETFRAVRGAGATLHGHHLRVSEPGSIQRAMIATGLAYDVDVRRAQGEHLAQLLGEVADVRRAGSAALDLAWCAAGRLDGFYEAGLGPWDWAAGTLLIREAGGAVTHHRTSLAGTSQDVVVAGSAPVHDHLAAPFGRSLPEPDMHAPAAD